MRFSAGVALASLNGVHGPVLQSAGRIALYGVAWFLATLFAYVFNGVMDVEEDRANGSRRPIAQGLLAPDVALRASGLCVAASLVLALLTGDPLFVALVVVHLVCGYAYSGRPFLAKRSPLGASVTVLLLGLLTYAAGATALDDMTLPPLAWLLFASAMSLWMCGVGAVLKDLSDVEGDTRAGRRTVAVVRGESRARLLGSVNALVIAAAFVLVCWLWAPSLRPAALVLAGGAIAIGTLSAAARPGVSRGRRRLPYRAFMTAQYGSHVLLGVSLIPYL